jgi:hypothetical protein
VASSGLLPIRLHDLRHVHAAVLIHEGVPITAVLTVSENRAAPSTRLDPTLKHEVHAAGAGSTRIGANLIGRDAAQVAIDDVWASR